MQKLIEKDVIKIAPTDLKSSSLICPSVTTEIQTRSVTVTKIRIPVTEIKTITANPETKTEFVTQTKVQEVPRIVTSVEYVTKFQDLPRITEIRELPPVTKTLTNIRELPPVTKTISETKTSIVPITSTVTVFRSDLQPGILNFEVDKKTITSVVTELKTIEKTLTATSTFTTTIVENCGNSNKMDGSEIDCGDKICSNHKELKESCIIYLPTPVPNCHIPCDLSGCKTKIEHLLECDIWHCFEKTTTTTSTTTTSTTTATTSSSTTTPNNSTDQPWFPLWPSFKSEDWPLYCQSILTIVSFGLNIILLVIILTWFIISCKRACKKRRNRRGYAKRTPIIRNNRNQSTSESRQQLIASQDTISPAELNRNDQVADESQKLPWFKRMFRKSDAQKQDLQPKINQYYKIDDESSSEFDDEHELQPINTQEARSKIDNYVKYGACKISDQIVDPQPMSQAFINELEEAERIQREYEKKSARSNFVDVDLHVAPSNQQPEDLGARPKTNLQRTPSLAEQLRKALDEREKRKSYESNK